MTVVTGNGLLGATPPPAPASAATARAVAAGGRRDAALLRDLVAVLCAFGLAMVLAASPLVSITDYGSAWSLVERQGMWLAIGGVAAVVASRIPSATWQRRATPLLVLSFGLLLAVLVPHLGSNVGGSSRWIGAGPIKIQPSELAKLAMAVFAADLMTRRGEAADQTRAVLRPLAIVGGAEVVLILRQPDLGTALIVVTALLAMCFAGGIRGRLLGVAMGCAGLLAVVGALAAPYRRARLLSFLDPFQHASTSGYQLVQSLLSLGSGHLFGTGVGASASTWGLLPNAQTDFIFPVVGNDLGIVGTLLVVAGFVLFARLGLRIAAQAPDRFSMLLAAGVTCWITCQAVFNIGGVIGVLPETGVPLPFVSFGGSSLVVTLAGCGILVRIGREGAAAAERPAAAPRRAAVPPKRPAPPRRAPASPERPAVPQLVEARRVGAAPRPRPRPGSAGRLGRAPTAGGRSGPAGARARGPVGR